MPNSDGINKIQDITICWIINFYFKNCYPWYLLTVIFNKFLKIYEF